MNTTDEAGNTQEKKCGYNNLNREEVLVCLTAKELML